MTRERQAGIEWLARYGGNDAKCGDTEGPFIYMGSRRAFDGGMKERRDEKGRKRKSQGGRTGGRSKAATRSRGASVLFLPCLSFIPPISLPSRDEVVEGLLLSSSRSLTHEFSFPETFSLRNCFVTRIANELI